MVIYDPDRVIDTDTEYDIDFKEFSYSYTVIIVFVILLILTAKRDLSIFVKINTFGVIFTMIIITFVVVNGIIGLYYGGFEYTTYIDNKGDENTEKTGQDKILLFGAAYSHLMGTLGGGFYLHNISLPIYQNSKKKENAVRDMFMGFFVVMLSYCVCGTMGIYGFKSQHFYGDYNGVINQNCLNMLSTTSPIAIIIRLCTFCQLLAGVSLIFAC